MPIAAAKAAVLPVHAVIAVDHRSSHPARDRFRPLIDTPASMVVRRFTSRLRLSRIVRRWRPRP